MPLQHGQLFGPQALEVRVDHRSEGGIARDGFTGPTVELAFAYRQDEANAVEDGSRSRPPPIGGKGVSAA